MKNMLIFLLLDPNAQEIKDIYGLQGQVEHKLAFLRTHVPKKMKLVVIGHSIGGYISLQILKRAPELSVSTPPECLWVLVGTCTDPPQPSLPFLSLV